MEYVLLAVLVESLGESVWWIRENGWEPERILALVLGLIVSALTGANLLDLIGLTPPEYVPVVVWQVFGGIAAALVIMRGANFVNDFLSIFQAEAKE